MQNRLMAAQQFKQISPKKLRQLQIVTIIAALVIAILLVGIFRIVANENEKLLVEGIQQKVVVVNKYRTGTRKQPRFHMKVAWFTEGEKVPLYQPKDTTGMNNSEKFSNDVLSTVFKDKHRTKLGDYNTFELKYISGDSYQNLKVGDAAILVYLKDKPSDGRLLREISEKIKNKHKKTEL